MIPALYDSEDYQPERIFRYQFHIFYDSIRQKSTGKPSERQPKNVPISSVQYYNGLLNKENGGQCNN